MHQVPRTQRPSVGYRSTDQETGPARSPSNVDLTAYTERAGIDTESAGRATIGRERAGSVATEEREQTKLNQIIQNFHTKAALTISASRANLPQVISKTGEVKQNRWFNLLLDETDILFDDLQEWKRQDLAENRPVPLILDVFVDTASLTPNQALVITDSNEKRWDIADSVQHVRRSSSGSDVREVLLERWTVQLGDAEGYTAHQLNDQLPNVYKKGVVQFRTLFTFLRLLPAWKLHRRLSRQPAGSGILRLKFRIRKGPHGRPSSRYLKESPFTPLCPMDIDPTKTAVTHTFEPLVCPAGPLSITVQYRSNCDLSIADAEALLSSRFAGLDAGLHDRSNYGRSLPGDRSTSDVAYSATSGQRPGQEARVSRLAGGGAYGSLGTFHAAGKRESPVAVLRQRALSQEDEDDASDPQDRTRRRQSQIADSDLLKNPPFKAGSFASSPRGLISPSSSLPRSPTYGSSVPKRFSITTMPQTSLRALSSHGEQAIASSGSASPKPAPMHRYSSSFAHRKRFTSQGSKAEESTTSSGRGSTSSKERSGQLAEGNGGSSGSGRTDEDDIAAFISIIERAKELPSTVQTRKASASNTINLSKFKGLGITSSELADEMSNSSLKQASLTPPSRRLSNVPALSTSSSPGRTFAPPVRSRLSTQRFAQDIPEGASDTAEAEPNQHSDDEEPFIFQQDNIL